MRAEARVTASSWAVLARFSSAFVRACSRAQPITTYPTLMIAGSYAAGFSCADDLPGAGRDVDEVSALAWPYSPAAVTTARSATAALFRVRRFTLRFIGTLKVCLALTPLLGCPAT